MNASAGCRRRFLDGAPRSDARGVALVEVIVAITLFAVLLPGFLLASGLAARDLQGARETTEWTAAVQRQMETLSATGYLDVTDGSATVEGHVIEWDVTDGDTRTVRVVVTVPTFSGKGKSKGLDKHAATKDTLWLYLPGTDSIEAADLEDVL